VDVCNDTAADSRVSRQSADGAYAV